MITWQMLQSLEQLEDIDSLSRNQKVLIFKHSTRCSISSIAKNRLESEWNNDDIDMIPFLLDLINYRDISNEIASKYHVYHESPQALVISNGDCTDHFSHLDISVEQLLESTNSI